MSLTSLDQQLNFVEMQLKAVSLAFIAGDPVAVQTSSAKLQQLAVDFLQLADELGKNSPQANTLKARLAGLEHGMSLARENLMRRAAYVERALELVVPRAPKATYAESNGPYGHAVRQAGNFKVFSA